MGSNEISATHRTSMSCAGTDWWRRRESNLGSDPEQSDRCHTHPGHNSHNSRHPSEIGTARSQDREHVPDTSEHYQGRSVHPESVPEEYQIPDDLGRVVEAWRDLPGDIRSAILAMVGSVSKKSLPATGVDP